MSGLDTGTETGEAATAAALSALVGGRGVRSAVLYSEVGAALASAGGEETTAGLLVPARAIVQTLERTLGTEGWNDLLLDLEAGPVLLTPSAAGQVLAVAFDDISSLGRVRLAVRRALDALAATSTPGANEGQQGQLSSMN